MKTKPVNQNKFQHKIARLIKHFFWPHRGNAYRPHAFRHQALVFYGITLLSTELILGVGFSGGPILAAGQDQSLNKNNIALTNQQRQNSGDQPLKENTVLDQAAQQKLADMFTLNYWDHTGPKGETAWSFMSAAGYHYQLAGENLAKGYTGSQDVITAWMASSEHRANILNQNFQEIGVASGSGKINGSETTIIVQLFGEPQNTALSVAGGTSTTVGGIRLLPEINLKVAGESNKVPYVALWCLLLAFVVADGLMIRKLGLNRSVKHQAYFSAALLIMVLGMGVLTIGFAAIA